MGVAISLKPSLELAEDGYIDKRIFHKEVFADLHLAIEGNNVELS